MPAAATSIGIAVVEHGGEFLVGIRGPDADLAGMAEFPGGKCHPGESPCDCAVRECEEEAGLAVIPVGLLHKQCYDYEHGNVELHFWSCRPCNVMDVSAAHQGFCWVPRKGLSSLDFPAGNAEAVELLLSE